jgi:hypothetical protein
MLKIEIQLGRSRNEEGPASRKPSRELSVGPKFQELPHLLQGPYLA